MTGITNEGGNKSFAAGLVSVGVLAGVCIAYLQALAGGSRSGLAFIIFCMAGGLGAFLIGLRIRRPPTRGVELIVEGVGLLFSLTGIGLFTYLLLATGHLLIPVSATMFGVVLWWRLVPSERRAVPIGIGSAILATVAIVEGIFTRKWPMIMIGLLFAIGIIIPFRERSRRKAN